MTARRLADGIEFVFKWLGLLLMLGVIFAIAATNPPGTLRPAAEVVGPTSAGAR